MKRMNVAMAVAAIVMILSSYAFAAGELKWLTLEEGTEKAKVEKKPMLVDFFFGKGCPRCEVLEKSVYGNPAIAKKIMEDFIPIRVDLTRKLTKDEEKLGEKYDYKKDCLLLFLDSAGNIIKDPGGKRLCFAESIEPDMFIHYLDTVKASLAKQQG